MPKYSHTEQHPHPKFPRLVLLLPSTTKNYLARTYLNGRLRYQSTKTDRLPTAFSIAAKWYSALLDIGAKDARKHPKPQNTMAHAHEAFLATRTGSKLISSTMVWNSHVEEFWAHRRIDEITPLVFREFYAQRRNVDGVKEHTLHKNVIHIRQVLKHCVENGQLSALPFIPKLNKITHNPRRWLTHAEWKHLQAVSKHRIKDAAPNTRTVQQRQDCHDFAMFMVHSMMRVGEVQHLTFRDCSLAKNSKGEPVLICDVRHSKTGHRPNVVCLSGAASVYSRRKTAETKPTDPLFQHTTTRAFKELMIAADLYVDADGETRNQKSLRATAISFRVLDGSANLALIARNAGTSIGSIDLFYAKYLRGTDDLDALTTIKRTRKR